MPMQRCFVTYLRLLLLLLVAADTVERKRHAVEHIALRRCQDAACSGRAATARL
jgi:hypothetical protein